MKKLLYLVIVAAAVMFASCKEEVVTQINPIAKAYFAPGVNDSYWEYMDLRATSADLRNFSVTVSDYEEYRNSCEEKKVYQEAISYKLGGGDCIVYSNSCTKDSTAYIKVAVPHSEPLYIEMDEQGNVDAKTCQKFEYLEDWNGFGTNFKDVLYLEVKRATDIYHYYYAKGIGLVYMYDDNQKVCLKLIGQDIH